MNTRPEPAAQIPDIDRARALLQRANPVRHAIRSVQERDESARLLVVQAYERMRERALREELARGSLDRLKAASDGRLRLGPLERHGIRNIRDVLEQSVHSLSQIHGIGEKTAEQVITAAEQIRDNVSAHLHVHIDNETAGRDGWETVQALYRVVIADDALTSGWGELERLGAELDAAAKPLEQLASRFRRLFAGRDARAAGAAAATRMDALLARLDDAAISRVLDAVASALAERGTPRSIVLADFEKRAARYHSILATISGREADDEAVHGHLPPADVSIIEKYRLNVSRLRATLRGYQAFGARFALERRRVILGDEMGTGKTVEAIAAMAHLAAEGRSHFLVVCPASVLINWTLEVPTHSLLTAHKLHGPDRGDAVAAWIEGGGVAVTTFDVLRSLDVPARLPVAMLTVDEAHYVKNHDTRRSQIIRTWTRRVDRVLFLTGTPMENHVGEFQNLVDYLRPEIARSVTGLDGASGARAFRRAVAPVYLRRNREDVLTELPPVVYSDEWEEMTAEDRRIYRAAVREGEFHAMRRAAFGTGDWKTSAKLNRLREIAEEAAENKRKILVFSFFLDVLDTVCHNLPEWITAYGPLTGSTPTHLRQKLVDDFTAAAAPAALVGQITAAGTGLNIQAASVVILCEPQLKPTAEYQAIGRAYRAGQTRSVTVHRLLAADSVDQRLMELLRGKELLFDAYARRSEIAERDPAATDLSEAQIESYIVNMERHRLKTDGEC